MISPIFRAVGFSEIEQLDPFTVVFMFDDFSDNNVSPTANVLYLEKQMLFYLCFTRKAE